MRIRTALVGAAVAGLALTATAPAALADKGGEPNDNACHGQLVSSAASHGFTPGHVAQNLDGVTAGDLNKLAKWFCSL